MNRKEQGTFGEIQAIYELTKLGYNISVPIGDLKYDLIAEIDGVALRVEVKTTEASTVTGGFQFDLRTTGGNQSWSGISRFTDSTTCDLLFLSVPSLDHCWLMPIAVVDGQATVTTGSKYGEYQIH